MPRAYRSVSDMLAAYLSGWRAINTLDHAIVSRQDLVQRDAFMADGTPSGGGLVMREDLQSTVGAVIRRERRKRRLSRRALAERAAVSTVYLGEVERGQKYPSARVLEGLAAALELETPDLLGLVVIALRGVTEQPLHGPIALVGGYTVTRRTIGQRHSSFQSPDWQRANRYPTFTIRLPTTMNRSTAETPKPAPESLDWWQPRILVFQAE